MATLALIRTKRPAILSPRVFRAAQREASDEALRYFQKNFIPQHFKRTAVNRYPEAYSGTVYAPARRHTPGREKGPKRIPLREYLQRIRTKRPLVKTGLTERIATTGEHSLVGRGDARRMILRGLPRYFFQRRNIGPGRFDKVKALEAIASSEADEIIRRLDAHLDRIVRKDFVAALGDVI